MGIGWFLASCAPPTAPPPIHNAPAPGKEVYRMAAKRFAAVIVTDKNSIDSWVGDHFSRRNAPKEADGGSAAPITPDGYFLTANHVLSHAEGRKVYIMLKRDGRIQAYPARIVWQEGGGDVAILHAEIATPDFYQWTDSSRWLRRGTPVMHAGISTGLSSPPGKLVAALPPTSGFRSSHRIRHDIPLEPGDSGGPLVDANGKLVGINSAVEYLVPLDTSFFIESEANRPNIAKIQSLIKKDRSQNRSNQEPAP